jgi:hypothetical protein
MPMRKTVVTLLVLAAIAGTALAHGGKSHRLLGTVKSLHEGHLTLTTAEGKEATVRLTAETRFEKDGKPVDRSALTAGVRVSIRLTEDDTTAVKVKLGAAGAHDN